MWLGWCVLSFRHSGFGCSGCCIAQHHHAIIRTTEHPTSFYNHLEAFCTLATTAWIAALASPPPRPSALSDPNYLARRRSTPQPLDSPTPLDSSPRLYRRSDLRRQTYGSVPPNRAAMSKVIRGVKNVTKGYSTVQVKVRNGMTFSSCSSYPPLIVVLSYEQ